jgi:ferredoxin
MNEFAIIADRYPSEWKHWQTIATKIAEKQGMNEKWIKHGFWRWKQPPQKISELAEEMGIGSGWQSSKDSKPFEYRMEQKGYPPDTRIEGRFRGPIDLTKAAAFLYALGDVVVDLDRDMLEVTYTTGTLSGHAFLFGNGQFTLLGVSGMESAKLFVRTTLRGLLCTSCGTCFGLCENNAILSEEDWVRINPDKCVRCKACLNGKCPSLYAID